MENQSYKIPNVGYAFYQYYSNGWTITCNCKRLIISNSGWKLFVREDEELEKLIFDPEKKTIEAVVKNPCKEHDFPRVADLSGVPELFEEIRGGIEDVLLFDTPIRYESVVPNEDRTVFEVK